VKPSDFPVGSVESRAAARAVSSGQERVQLRVIVEYIPYPADQPLFAPTRYSGDDGMIEIAYVAGGA
jgi:hypothetical protein